MESEIRWYPPATADGEREFLTRLAEEEEACTGSLDVSGLGFRSLEPLKRLTTLRRLDCSTSTVDDLSPLEGFPELEFLNCNLCPVSDVSPLRNLRKLRELKIASTKVCELSALSELVELRVLFCFFTDIDDISVISRMPHLEHLDAGYCKITELPALHPSCRLRKLAVNETSVADIAVLTDQTDLVEFYCGGTPLDNIEPLAGAESLEDLNMASTAVTDLRPLEGLKRLRNIRCGRNTILHWTPQLFSLPSLTTFSAPDARIRGIPSGLLSAEGSENALPAIRAHLESLASGSAPMDRTKIVLLGNGRVGKTQLARWLMRDRYRRLGETPFEENSPSTHGVRVLADAVAVPTGGESRTLKVSLWDFGGQEIYHGTHSLFLSKDAVFIICWCPGQEDVHEQELDGLLFRNYPLAYWVEYVRRLAGTDAPLLLVQTHCDEPGQEERRTHPGLDLGDFSYPPRQLAFGACSGRGGAALSEAIGDAADWLTRQSGEFLIGAGRKAVIERLEAWRTEDSERPSEEREHKLVTQAEFASLCEEEGENWRDGYFLQFLHRIGVVFYEKGLFQDKILLDQNWALAAIYAVFNREVCYRPLKAMGGHFTPSLLGLMAWEEYSDAEQSLFVTLMESCGIAFLHRLDETDPRESDYIAPDLLPTRAEREADIRLAWRDGAPTAEASLRYGLLHPGLMRDIISGIGAQARAGAVYWRGGVLFHAAEFNSNVRIEEALDPSGWSGEVRISCQQGEQDACMERLIKWVTERSEILRLLPDVERKSRENEPSKPIAIAPLPRNPTRSAWYISYAWGDETPEGRERERAVDELCAEAAERGVEIIRDVTHCSNGESILKFMDRLSAGDRIIVVLSERYLHSEFCMYELYEMWRRRPDEEEFAADVRVFSLPSAKLRSWQERAAIARYWRTTVEEVRAYEREFSGADIGMRDAVKHRLMQRYATEVADILAAIQDRISPKDWQSFLDYAFAPDRDEAGS